MSKIVARTVDFLELFAAQKRALSSTEIARLLNIAPSSCHDVLRALLERGYLYELTPRRGYYPTLRLFGLAKAIADHDPVALRAEPPLRTLRDRIDESILLSKINGLGATYLLSMEPAHPLRFLATIGDHLSSLHATSAGKALLGTLDAGALDEFLSRAKLQAFTANTIVSKSALRNDLAIGGRRGWYLNDEESQIGVMTISSRFRWASAIFVVTVAGPTSRLGPKLNEAVALLIRACKSLDGPPCGNMHVGRRSDRLLLFGPIGSSEQAADIREKQSRLLQLGGEARGWPRDGDDVDR
jgi:DNA-binding IclR family transcriptional regulator